MKTNLTMQDLQQQFKLAISEKYKWFAIKFYIPGYEGGQWRINSLANIEKELEYLETAYDENLIHIKSGVIKIVDFDYADYIDELKFADSKG